MARKLDVKTIFGTNSGATVIDGGGRTPWGTAHLVVIGSLSGPFLL
jgi:hypothetical protein